MALVAACGFAALALRLGPGSPPTGIDLSVQDAVAGHAGLAAAGSWASDWLPRLAQIGLALVFILLLVASQWRTASAMVLAEAVAPGLVEGLKSLVHRARPPGANVAGFAFPSGHAMAGAVEWGLLLVVAVPALRGNFRPPRALVVAWAVLAGAAGSARVLEGVHWLTDVLASWLLGACIVGLAAWLGTRSGSGKGRSAGVVGGR
jgi:undecaprenyl-diphosphatase